MCKLNIECGMEVKRLAYRLHEQEMSLPLRFRQATVLISHSNNFQPSFKIALKKINQ